MVNQKSKTSSSHEQTVYVREVLVNYQKTQQTAFKIHGPQDIADFVRSVLTDNSREHAVALYMDSTHRIVSYSIISIGSTNVTLLHPREVFQRAVLVGAVAVAVAHNHPSGDLTPSKEDERITKQLTDAGEILGIKLLDHVIVTDFSFRSLKNG